MKNNTHDEAPASANVRLYGQSGADILLTVRSGATVEEVTSVIDVLAVAMRHAKQEYGLEPSRKPQASQPANGQSQPAASVTVPTGGEIIPAEEMTATVNDGKVYWKVKGGQYRKWGVTIWPETLEAAGLTNLDPTKPVNLAGYVAHVAMKEDGKPSKVTRLERVN